MQLGFFGQEQHRVYIVIRLPIVDIQPFYSSIFKKLGVKYDVFCLTKFYQQWHKHTLHISEQHLNFTKEKNIY